MKHAFFGIEVQEHQRLLPIAQAKGSKATGCASKFKNNEFTESSSKKSAFLRTSPEHLEK